MYDVVIPYRVTRTYRRFGLFPAKTVWHARLLLSDVHFAECPDDSPRCTYARKALLTVLEVSAPSANPGVLKWEQIELGMPNDEVVAVK